MDSGSLEGLCHHFDTKLTNLTSCLELRCAVNDPVSQKLLADLNTELQSLENTLRLMKTELNKQKKEFASVDGIMKGFVSFLEDLEYTVNNIPQRLPNTQDIGNGSVEPVSVKNSGPSAAVNQSNCNARSGGALPEGNSATDKPFCPVIDYLRVDEFEDVPKYMKGRHTYDRVNLMIDSLNQSLKAKYKILRMKKSSLNDVNRKRFEDFRKQENQDTKGFYFVVESDLKDFSNIKLDATNRAILTILRQTKRIREIRNAGIIRYAVLEPY